MEAARFIPEICILNLIFFVISICRIYECAIWNGFPRSSYILVSICVYNSIIGTPIKENSLNNSIGGGRTHANMYNYVHNYKLLKFQGTTVGIC